VSSIGKVLPPADLADFAVEECGPVATWRDASWDHGESDVWHAALASGDEVYVKRHRQPAKFAQERAAYERWAPAVGSCPRLIAAQGGTLRALILEAVPGQPLLLSSVPQDREAEHYAEAGRWLRRLHELPWQDEDPVDVAAALTTRSAAWSERARALPNSPLTSQVIDEVHARVSAPWPTSMEIPARAPCHRDFTARNWIVTGSTLRIIDFEHARADWSFVDLERVASSIPSDRSDLWSAFQSGYGRTLDDTEQALLMRLQFHAALSRVVWAVEHKDREFERSGMEQLSQLLKL
jgi:Ser/Thr protein kinase RdoA (MazF antagonist)